MTWRDLTGVLQPCAVCCVVLCVKPPSVCVPELLPGRLTAHGPRDNSNSPFQKGQQKLSAKCPGERLEAASCIETLSESVTVQYLGTGDGRLNHNVLLTIMVCESSDITWFMHHNFRRTVARGVPHAAGRARPGMTVRSFCGGARATPPSRPGLIVRYSESVDILDDYLISTHTLASSSTTAATRTGASAATFVRCRRALARPFHLGLALARLWTLLALRRIIRLLRQ